MGVLHTDSSTTSCSSAEVARLGPTPAFDVSSQALTHEVDMVYLRHSTTWTLVVMTAADFGMYMSWRLTALSAP